MSERPKIPAQIEHDADVIAEAENAVDGLNKLSLCVEWLMRETLLHLAAHEKRSIQVQNIEPSRYCAICSNKECGNSGTERTTATCRWRPPGPKEPEKVYPFDCENCGNGERGNCPLALSECSGKNDFAKWVRPLTQVQEPKDNDESIYGRSIPLLAGYVRIGVISFCPNRVKQIEDTIQCGGAYEISWKIDGRTGRLIDACLVLTSDSPCQHEWEWAYNGEFKVCLKCQLTEYKDGRQVQTVWCICAEPDVGRYTQLMQDYPACNKCGNPLKPSPFQEEPQ